MKNNLQQINAKSMAANATGASTGGRVIGGHGVSRDNNSMNNQELKTMQSRVIMKNNSPAGCISGQSAMALDNFATALIKRQVG